MLEGMETKQKRRQVMNYIMKGKESLNAPYDVGGSTDTVGGERTSRWRHFDFNMNDDNDDEFSLLKTLQQNLKVLS
jgi:hypothetical protein